MEDNRQTESRFRLLVEHFATASSAASPTASGDGGTIAYHSLAAHHASLRLHYPPIILERHIDHATSADRGDQSKNILRIKWLIRAVNISNFVEDGEISSF